MSRKFSLVTSVATSVMMSACMSFVMTAVNTGFSPGLLPGFLKSFLITIAGTGMNIVLTSVTAYALSKKDLPGRDWMMKLVIFFMLFHAGLIPDYILVANSLKLTNTYWAIWLPGIFSPYAVFLLTKYMRRIPKSLMEAAKIDGAGEWEIFTKVAMPLCKGALGSVAILIFIDYWNMVEQPLIMLSDEQMHPLSVFLSKINSGEIGLAFAVATIYMVPTLLVFLYGEEYLLDGIAYQGGIKG